MMKKQNTNIPNLIKEYSIFIDTSSLMRSQAQDFLMQKIFLFTFLTKIIEIFCYP